MKYNDQRKRTKGEKVKQDKTKHCTEKPKIEQHEPTEMFCNKKKIIYINGIR
jgi:hypothetical protein